MYIDRWISKVSMTSPIAFLAVLAVLCAVAPLKAQDKPTLAVAEEYIIFFHMHAPDARARSAREYEETRVRNRARHLGLQPHELESLDDLALRFVEQEKALKLEARSYLKSRMDSGQPVSEAVLQSFTVRRNELAAAAFAALGARLSPESLERLQSRVKQMTTTSVEAFGR